MFSILDYNLAEEGFFIKLPQSKERLDHVNFQIDRYKIKNLNRFEALTDDLHVFSCTKSHLEVFKNAKEKKLKTIFVAEDDFLIQETCYHPKKRLPLIDVLNNITEEMKLVDWDVILLGCNPKSNTEKITNSLYKVYKSTGAWAYLIKETAYNYLLDNLNYKRDYIAIDDYLPLLNQKGFVTLTTVPMSINHGIGFVSTLQPNGPVNYDLWIQGNYHNFIYNKENQPTDLSKILNKE